MMALGAMCCKGQKFDVRNLEGGEVGVITKEFSGMAKELFTDADNFSVTFPLDLDARVKATMLGAVFLIDFNFFETPPDRK